MREISYFFSMSLKYLSTAFTENFYIEGLSVIRCFYAATNALFLSSFLWLIEFSNHFLTALLPIAKSLNVFLHFANCSSAQITFCFEFLPRSGSNEDFRRSKFSGSVTSKDPANRTRFHRAEKSQVKQQIYKTSESQAFCVRFFELSQDKASVELSWTQEELFCCFRKFLAFL